MKYRNRQAISLFLAFYFLFCFAFLMPNRASSQDITGRSDESRRVSECTFRLVVDRAGGDFSAEAQRLLEQLASIGRITGHISIQETLGAMRGGTPDVGPAGQIRDALIRLGISPNEIGLLPPSTRRSQDGAWIRVCAPFRNVEGSWRHQPQNPTSRVQIQIGSATLLVPIQNLGPGVWNDVPFEEMQNIPIYFVQNSDQRSIINLLNICWPDFQRNECNNIGRIDLSSVEAQPPFLEAFDRHPQGSADSYFLDPLSRRPILTRRRPAGSDITVLTQCQLLTQPSNHSTRPSRVAGNCTAISRFMLYNIAFIIRFQIEDQNQIDLFVGDAVNALRGFLRARN